MWGGSLSNVFSRSLINALVDHLANVFLGPGQDATAVQEQKAVSRAILRPLNPSWRIAWGSTRAHQLGNSAKVDFQDVFAFKNGRV